jgi:hypothetical protein
MLRALGVLVDLVRAEALRLEVGPRAWNRAAGSHASGSLNKQTFCLPVYARFLPAASTTIGE